MNCVVFDPLKVQNMSSGLYFPAVISAVFACTKVFDTFTKLFFFYVLVLQAKNVLANQSYMQKNTYHKWVWADTSVCTFEIHDLL